MVNPSHPGEILKEMYLDPLGLRISDVASRMGMSKVDLCEIVNNRRGISPRVAIKLAKALSCSAELWVKLQKNYDFWQAKMEYDAANVEALYAPPIIAEALHMEAAAEIAFAPPKMDLYRQAEDEE